MAKNITNTTPRKNRVLRGKVAPVSIVLGTKAATLVAVLVIYWLLAIFAAVQVVPMIMNFVKAGSGVSLDMPFETVLSFWIAPAVFLIALLFALVLVAMRGLWRLRVRLVTSVSRWALGEETGAVSPSMGVAVERVYKQKNTSKKAA